MEDESRSKESSHAELMELHRRIVELDKLEIERERIEKKLREVEDKIPKMFGDAEEVIVVVQDRQIKYVNPSVEKLIGYTPAEIKGTLFAKYIHPDELSRVAKAYLQRIAGEDMEVMFILRLKLPWLSIEGDWQI